MPRLIPTVLLILLLLVLAACANSTLLPPPPAIPTPVVILPTPQVLTYITPFTASPIQTWNQRTVTDFENRANNVKVEHAAMLAAQYQAQLSSWLQQNPAPDLLTFNLNYELRTLAAEGQVRGLGEVWQEAGWDQEMPAAFRQAVSLKDEPYFFPYTWYWWGLWYRQSILDEVGIAPPQTWDELLQTCDALRAADYIPITIGLQERWPAAAWFDYLDLRLNGVDFHRRLMDGQERYDSPQVRDVFSHWAELLDHHCFIDEPDDLTWQEALDFMKQKQAGMMLMGQFLIEAVPTDQRPDYDFVAFPRLREGVPVAEEAPLDVYFVPQNAEHPAAALRFLVYLGSNSVQTNFVQTTRRLPTLPTARDARTAALSQKGLELINQAQDLTQFYDRDTPRAMADAGLDAMLGFWKHPHQIEAVLRTLEKARKRAFTN